MKSWEHYVLIKHVHSITYFINWFICYVLFITKQIALNFIRGKLFQNVVNFCIFFCLFIYIPICLSLFLLSFSFLSPNIWNKFITLVRLSPFSSYYDQILSWLAELHGRLIRRQNSPLNHTDVAWSNSVLALL